MKVTRRAPSRAARKPATPQPAPTSRTSAPARRISSARSTSARLGGRRRRPRAIAVPALDVIRLAHGHLVRAEDERAHAWTARGGSAARGDDARGDVHRGGVVPSERLAESVDAVQAPDLLHARLARRRATDGQRVQTLRRVVPVPASASRRPSTSGRSSIARSPTGRAGGDATATADNPEADAISAAMRPRAARDCRGRHERFLVPVPLASHGLPPFSLYPLLPLVDISSARHPRIRSQRHPTPPPPHRLFRFHHEDACLP